jgi:hypothetical protein
MRAWPFLHAVAALALLTAGWIADTPAGASPDEASLLSRPDGRTRGVFASVVSGSLVSGRAVQVQVLVAAGRGTSPIDSLPPDSMTVDPPGLSDSLPGVADSLPGGIDSPAVAADSLPGRHSAIVVGERLVFSVRYGMIKAGTAVMEVVDRKKVDGRPGYHVVSTANSNSMFDGIYRVRDRVVSLMDEDRLYSLYFEKHLREGRYRADQQVRFDQVRAVATYQDGREAAVTPGAFDVLAAFYRVRTMPLQPGQTLFLESHDNRKNYPLRVTVRCRERVETPAGTFDCLVVEPTLRSGAFFKNEGKLTIWLTDDDRRMPVLMRSKLPIGAISVELIEYRRPLHPQTSAPLKVPPDSTGGAAADSARIGESTP